MIEDLLEGVVCEGCHGVGVVSVAHADRVVDRLQDAAQSVHVDLRGLRLRTIGGRDGLKLYYTPGRDGLKPYYTPGRDGVKTILQEKDTPERDG